MWEVPGNDNRINFFIALHKKAVRFVSCFCFITARAAKRATSASNQQIRLKPWNGWINWDNQHARQRLLFILLFFFSPAFFLRPRKSWFEFHFIFIWFFVSRTLSFLLLLVIYFAMRFLSSEKAQFCMQIHILPAQWPKNSPVRATIWSLINHSCTWKRNVASRVNERY